MDPLKSRRGRAVAGRVVSGGSHLGLITCLALGTQETSRILKILGKCHQPGNVCCFLLRAKTFPRVITMALPGPVHPHDPSQARPTWRAGRGPGLLVGQPHRVTRESGQENPDRNRTQKPFRSKVNPSLRRSPSGCWSSFQVRG
ncbi:hypothetical protein H1C71_018531 [Ictidomys tridecemlineatus]|nr:hypothetical protein H1C71_018531 [Ictidomys tridecemlineatus]